MPSGLIDVFVGLLVVAMTKPPTSNKDKRQASAKEVDQKAHATHDFRI